MYQTRFAERCQGMVTHHSSQRGPQALVPIIWTLNLKTIVFLRCWYKQRAGCNQIVSWRKLILGSGTSDWGHLRRLHVQQLHQGRGLLDVHNTTPDATHELGVFRIIQALDLSNSPAGNRSHHYLHL